MKGISLLVLALVLHMAWPWSVPLHAASKYKACTLLTAAELEAVVRAKMTTPDDSDYVFPDGALRGETVSSCGWMGSTWAITLSVLRGPRTPEQRAAVLAFFRDQDETLKKQGWTIVEVAVGGAACATYRPPAGQNLLAAAGCAVESKGFTTSLAVFGLNATPQQVKGLVDKAVARLP